VSHPEVFGLDPQKIQDDFAFYTRRFETYL
jgi:hypothetical protein